MKSVFHMIAAERVHHSAYATRYEASRDLFAKIDGVDNLRRLYPGLGDRSPTGMERIAD